ncbi:MAG: DUF2341 domain-containing protein [Chitinispirillaceae bacterium]|nr:DUF2341 domain-containing protein [Chitinispirillaceae bacterium]
MRNPIITAFFAAAGAVLLTLHCVSLNQVSGGSSSETVIGRVANDDGSPACSTIVTLYPVDYDPVCDTPLARSSTDTTDVNGEYSVQAPDSSARYSIVATKPGSGTRSFVAIVNLRGDTTQAPDAVLQRPGAISVAAPDTADIINGYVYIPGTGIAVFVSGGNGMTLLDQVPAGTIPSVNYASKTAPGTSSVLAAGIEVVSGDTVVIPFPQWRYSRKLHLNTTASGAGVSGDVTDFPVLIRLTRNSFDFTQAQDGGADLRFSSSEGVPLAYEIEQWDATANSAAIWVRMPAVFGNNDAQHIVMHWGASAKSLSNGAAVFDTAAGFQGIWHLAGAGNGTAHDATVNQYNGTPYNMTAVSAVDGIIGSARDFNGSTSYITMPSTASGKLNMPQNGAYSISLWAYADTIDTLWHAIAGKGHEQYYLKLKCFGNGRATWEFVAFQDRQGWAYTEDSVPPAPGQKQWVFLTGVRLGTNQYLYINGVMVNDSTPLMTGNYARNTGDDFTIGRHGRQVTIPYFEGWCYFNGKIDEVRVMNRAPGADWIRLCYMNQKMEDALVEFR